MVYSTKIRNKSVRMCILAFDSVLSLSVCVVFTVSGKYGPLHEQV